MANEHVGSAYGTNLAVDKDKNVFIMNDDKIPKAYLGQIIYHDNEPVFIPSNKTPNRETGTMAFNVHIMRGLINVLETIQQKPSDEEIDALFNGNQNESN